MSCSGAGACVDNLYVARLSSPGLMNVLFGTHFPVYFLFVNPNDANDFVQCDHVGLDTTTIPTPLLCGNFLDPSTVSEELISWVLFNHNCKVVSLNYNPVSRTFWFLVELIKNGSI